MDTENATKYGRGLSYFLFFLVLVTLAVRYAMPIRDSDVWFHLSYGKYFIENLTLIPDHTIYSWTPASNALIYCTWLVDIFLYGLYSLGGVPALLGFRYVCLLVFVALVAGFAKRTKTLFNPLIWLLCLVGLLMSHVAVFAKPEIMSYVYMSLVVWNYWNIRWGGEAFWKSCYLFPVITLLWVNSHGGVVFGYVFLFLIGVAEILNLRLYTSPLPAKMRKHFFYGLFLCCATLFMTPYGYHYPLQLLATFVPSETNLAFMRAVGAYSSPFQGSNPTLDMGNLADIALVILALVTLPLVRSKKIECSFILTNLVFAFLYTRFYRTTFYWVPVFVFSLLYLLSFRPALLFPTGRWRKILQNSIIVILALFLAGKSSYDLLTMPMCFEYFGLDSGELSPYDEAEYIEKHYAGYDLGTTYETGAYLAWKLWPTNKIMMDARQFPFRDWYLEYNNFCLQPYKYAGFMDRFPCKVWCINYRYLELLWWFNHSTDWELVYVGKIAAVYVKKDLLTSGQKPEKNYQAIGEIKGPQQLIWAYRFALILKDWQTADVVAKRMEERSWQPVTKKIAAWAAKARKVYFAYDQQDYPEVVRLFSQPNFFESETDRVLFANAYLFLGEDAWNEQRDLEALQYFEKAHKICPTQFTLFDLGVARRILAERAGEGNISGQQQGWRAVLAEFLAMKYDHDNEQMNGFREIAAAMMDGSYSQPRPPLYLPERGY